MALRLAADDSRVNLARGRRLDLEQVTRSLILSGGRAYADPWHPFAATSERLAGILAGLGYEVEISDLVADRVADLRGWDLIVVNAASGPQADTGTAAPRTASCSPAPPAG